MIEGQGIFQLAARSAAYAAFARDTDAVHGRTRNVFERSEKPSGLGSLTIDANTTIRAMFQQAWDKLHADGKMVTDENMKRLEKASKSDNKEIAAERLRQAKAKLRALRLQAQVAAASGDTKMLRRIAQQAAAAAREVASAARGLAQGIAASASASTSDSSGSVPLTANGETGDKDTGGKNASGEDGQKIDYTAAPPADGDSLAWGRDALRQLGDETRAAIAQARGLIAFAAQAAKMRRHHRPDPAEDSDYRALQQSVTESAQDLESSLNAAWQSLQAGGESGADGSAGLDTVTDSTTVTTTTAIFVQVTTELTFTANLTV